MAKSVTTYEKPLPHISKYNFRLCKYNFLNIIMFFFYFFIY